MSCKTTNLRNNIHACDFKSTHLQGHTEESRYEVVEYVEVIRKHLKYKGRIILN